MCSASAVLKTGKKNQLIKRMLGMRRFGSLSERPSSKKGSVKLQYGGDSSAPLAITCKHMRDQGRPCGFSKKLIPGDTRQILVTQLHDTHATTSYQLRPRPLAQCNTSIAHLAQRSGVLSGSEYERRHLENFRIIKSRSF